MSGIIESQRYKDKIKAAIAAIRMRDFAENSLSRQTGARSPSVSRGRRGRLTTDEHGFTQIEAAIVFIVCAHLCESVVNSSAQSSAPRSDLLTKLLIGQKAFGIFVSKENQPHFFQLPVGRQKIFDCARRNFRGFSSRICVDPSRDRREGD